jgi:hypothetical protein
MSDQIDGGQDSLLTERYRETLELQPESNNYVRDTRAKMRQRVRTGLYDFTYLNQYAEERDIKEIFDAKHVMSNRLKDGDPDVPDVRKEKLASDSPFPGQFIPIRHMIEFAYRGMRANGVGPQEFAQSVLEPALMYGEAKHKSVDPARVESKIGLTLEVHDSEGMDPVEKWKHDVPLSKEDFSELYDRLPEADPDRKIGEQIREHLIDE